MLRVALTGGIATGKSYCLARLAALGAPVIDADRLARDAVAPGAPGLAGVTARFGAEVLAADGTLDRARLAAVVFADPDARRDLERIIHPVVFRAISDWAAGLAAAGRALAVADVPLLYETGHDRDFDRVVVAACAPDLQVQRLAERNGLSEPEARRRLAAQWPVERKRAAADYVIDTGGTFEETDRQVEDVWRALQRDAAARNR